MTDSEAQQMIAYMYQQTNETAAVGVVLGQVWTYVIIAVICLLVIIYFLALRRN